MSELLELLTKFVTQAHQGSDLSVKQYPKTFRGLRCDVSFGKGTRADVAWISFYAEGQALPGHFASFYYDWRASLLFSVLGVSEKDYAEQNWPPDILDRYPEFVSIEDSPVIARRYPRSRRYARYSIDTENIPGSLGDQIDAIENDLDSMLKQYRVSLPPPIVTLAEMLAPYILAFKERYPELEQETGDEERTGSERREWMKGRVDRAFSKENIDSLEDKEAIDLLSNFWAIKFGGGGGGGAFDENGVSQSARAIVEQGFVERAKDLLYGEDPFPVRYTRFLETKGVGHGTASELLSYHNPQEYGIINTPSERGLFIFGINRKSSVAGPKAGEFAVAFFGKLKHVLSVLREDSFFADRDLQTLDYFLYFVSTFDIWRVAAGDNGIRWEDRTWQTQGIASFVPTGIEQVLKEDVLTADEARLREVYRELYPKKNKKSENETVKLLDIFLHQVNIGDVLVANKGKEAVLGYGIITSEPKFSPTSDDDLQLYRDVLWIERDLWLEVPAEFSKFFEQTITWMKYKLFKLIMSSIPERKLKDVVLPPPPPIKLYATIRDLLQHKKQVILYGPPGTGKTYHANRFISGSGPGAYDIAEKSLINQNTYVLVTFSSKYELVPDLSEGDRFTYEWKGRHNWRRYFDEIQEGDLALVYYSPQQRMIQVVRCLDKGEDSLEFQVIRNFSGATYRQMKDSPALQDAPFLRTTMSFSLASISEHDFRRVLSLSEGVTYESLGLEESLSTASIPKKEFVTFHPSFGYEEFVEGLRPGTSEDDALTYRVEEGVFKSFSRCAFNVLLKEAGIDREWTDSSGVPQLDDREKAKVRDAAPKVPFYLVIDEINRGDIARIFGELITLLEADKRYCEENELVVKLPYSKQSFAVPPNLYLIGTMNTADRSISLVDIALRRRFGFVELMPDCDTLLEMIAEKGKPAAREVARTAASLLERVNARIVGSYDRDHQVGHSYFVRIHEAETKEEAIERLHFAWYHEVIPLLQEYYYDAPRKLHDILGDSFVKVHPDGKAFSFQEPLEDEAFLTAIGKLAGSSVASATPSLGE